MVGRLGYPAPNTLQNVKIKEITQTNTAALHFTDTLLVHTYFACTASLVKIKGFMGGLLGGDGWGALYRNKQLLIRISINLNIKF